MDFHSPTSAGCDFTHKSRVNATCRTQNKSSVYSIYRTSAIWWCCCR